MLELILNSKITIGLILSFMGYIVVRDTLRIINSKKAEKQAIKNIQNSQKRSDLLFEEMKKNKTKFESVMGNIRAISEELKQQQQQVDNEKKKSEKTDSDPKKTD